MRTATSFDTTRHHIHIEPVISTGHGLPWSIKAVMDTGAPWTEVSDRFLHFAGLVDEIPEDVTIGPGLQTQKYGRLVLPEFNICGQTIAKMEIKVSRFDEHWEIAALIGLDFFRRFPVTIDYQRGVLEVG